MRSTASSPVTNATAQDRRRFVGQAALGLAAGGSGLIGLALAPPAFASDSADAGLAAIGNAITWINSPRLAPADLRGKVVLVQFWTYTCINWLRSQPFVRAWSEHYKDDGLVVIGVHAPEYSFEKNVDNVRRASAALKVASPIVIDNEHAIWRAFGNQYWPALYFIDAKGRIRHQQFGEGDYAKSEATLRRLLAEAGAQPRGPAPVDPHAFELAADWASLKSPENYLGAARTQQFASPGGIHAGSARTYALPTRWRLNDWALGGDWTLTDEAASLDKSGGRLASRFHARDLHMVLGPKSPGTSVAFRVRIDGQAPGGSHGLDVDADGNGMLAEQRLYELIRQPSPIRERQFEIEFAAPGAQAFAFTFG
ncbi:MAG: redoxin family protein [Ramlibacter sp.]